MPSDAEWSTKGLKVTAAAKIGILLGLLSTLQPRQPRSTDEALFGIIEPWHQDVGHWLPHLLPCPCKVCYDVAVGCMKEGTQHLKVSTFHQNKYYPSHAAAKANAAFNKILVKLLPEIQQSVAQHDD